MALRTVLGAMVAACTILFAGAGTARAECMNLPLGRDEPPVVAFAFTGTVTNVERGDYVEDPASGLHTWNVAVVVDAVHRGAVPDRLNLRSADWGCSLLYTGNLAKGDRIFIASERLRPGVSAESDLGHVLAWIGTGDRWAFYENGLSMGSFEDYYPAAARAATTTGEILLVVSRAVMPETSTVAAGDSGSVPAWLLAAVLVAALCAVLLRTRPRGAAA